MGSYAKRVRARLRTMRPISRGTALAVSAGILALTIGGAAIAQQGGSDGNVTADTAGRQGQPWILGQIAGTRANPIAGQTQLFSNNAQYALRESNLSTTGGGAIHGCRTGPPPANAADPGPSPCLRANNLSNGQAFQFQTTNGTVGGRIQVGGSNLATVNPNGVPFETNASGLVRNLNADKVDGLDAEQLRGERGPTGPAGPAGPPGLSNVNTTTQSLTLNPGDADAVAAACNQNQIATGGGYNVTSGDAPIDFPDVFVTGDGPVIPSANAAPTGWTASVNNESTETVDVTVWAVCANATP
jgi:hypothetical protein